MLIMQLLNIRKGVVTLPKDSTPQHITVAHVKKTAWYTARAIMHIVIMQFIRGWAYVSHFFAKKWQEWFGYNSTKKDSNQTPQKESFFLHSVGEYKMKLQRIKQRLREKETPQKDSQ